MRARAAAILIEAGRVALIERHRAGRHYFTFPGGHVEAGETPAQAVVREVQEELGLEVIIRKEVARLWFKGHPQHYFLVAACGGTFGTGKGEEMLGPLPGKGTYRPCWMPVQDLPGQPVLPKPMAEMVVRAQTSGWPDEPPAGHE